MPALSYTRCTTLMAFLFLALAYSYVVFRWKKILRARQMDDFGGHTSNPTFQNIYVTVIKKYRL